MATGEGKHLDSFVANAGTRRLHHRVSIAVASSNTAPKPFWTLATLTVVCLPYFMVTAATRSAKLPEFVVSAIWIQTPIPA
jgi:hypothetical protein